MLAGLSCAYAHGAYEGRCDMQEKAQELEMLQQLAAGQNPQVRVLDQSQAVYLFLTHRTSF